MNVILSAAKASDHLVSFDKVFKAIHDSGRDTHTKNNETSRGGLAVNVVECYTLRLMIFGIGIDIVEISRITASIAEFGDRFLDKIFTFAERDYCQAHRQPEPRYAARFAAKEAIAKALGTGIGKDVSWLDIEIYRTSVGEPKVRLSGATAHFCEKHHIAEIKISLTHTNHYAAANAIALLAI